MHARDDMTDPADGIDSKAGRSSAPAGRRMSGAGKCDVGVVARMLAAG